MQHDAEIKASASYKNYCVERLRADALLAKDQAIRALIAANEAKIAKMQAEIRECYTIIGTASAQLATMDRDIIHARWNVHNYRNKITVCTKGIDCLEALQGNCPYFHCAAELGLIAQIRAENIRMEQLRLYKLKLEEDAKRDQQYYLDKYCALGREIKAIYPDELAAMIRSYIAAPVSPPDTIKQFSDNTYLDTHKRRALYQCPNTDHKELRYCVQPISFINRATACAKCAKTIIDNDWVVLYSYTTVAKRNESCCQNNTNSSITPDLITTSGHSNVVCAYFHRPCCVELRLLDKVDTDYIRGDCLVLPSMRKHGDDNGKLYLMTSNQHICIPWRCSDAKGLAPLLDVESAVTSTYHCTACKTHFLSNCKCRVPMLKTCKLCKLVGHLPVTCPLFADGLCKECGNSIHDHVKKCKFHHICRHCRGHHHSKLCPNN